jgi:hypothetical protein
MSTARRLLERERGRVRPGSQPAHPYIDATGIDGETFKGRYLMHRYGVQVNKTSRNTVLFMTNMGRREARSPT